MIWLSELTKHTYPYRRIYQFGMPVKKLRQTRRGLRFTRKVLRQYKLDKAEGRA